MPNNIARQVLKVNIGEQDPRPYYINVTNRQLIDYDDALSVFLSNMSGGGGGGGVTQVTSTQLQSLISSSSLVPSTIYKITGFNKNMLIGSPENPNGYLPEILFDDGTNSGITIYMQALTTNTLAKSGYGEFYNPKYGDGNTYYNTDGTGLYRIWDGNNPDPSQVPVYLVGDVVFWGGYAWENISGNVGNDIDVTNLTPLDWQKLPYSNSTWYTKVIDHVSVDWDNKIIIERYNAENQIRVSFSADTYGFWYGWWTSSPQLSAISVMGWGLYSKVTPEQIDIEFLGISDVDVINGWAELVNWKGAFMTDVKIITSDLVFNYFGKDTYFYGIHLFTSLFRFNDFVTGPNSGACYLESSIFNNSIFSNNYFENSSFADLYFNGFVSVSENDLIDGGFFNIEAFGSSIDRNNLLNSTIINVELKNNSAISFSDLSFSDIRNCKFYRSTLDLSNSGQLTSLDFQNNYMDDCIINVDISGATHVFQGNYTKKIMRRLNGTPVLYYFNNTPALVAVSVTA